MQANPNVQILLEDETDPSDGRLLRIDGRALVWTDAGVLRRYLLHDVRKYILTAPGPGEHGAPLQAALRLHAALPGHERNRLIIDVEPTQ